MSDKSPSLLHLNPVHKKVPVLVHKGKPICESLVILEYIDDTWKQRPLLPQDPHEESLVCFWAKFGDEKLLPSIWNVFMAQGREQEEASVSALENLKLMEQLLKERKFFGGDTIGYLDLAFGWTENLISVLEEIISLKLVDAQKFLRLSTWMENFSDDPTIKDFWPPQDKLVMKFQALRENYHAASAPK